MLTAESIAVDPPAEGEIVDPVAWFDTPGSFELEIGCGKGGFLLDRALANPGVRLLGIEWANKYYKYCADRMARRGVSNVRVMRTDARFFVMNHLRPGCVDVLHLYHPDPWPKKRHHKRRLIQPDFVDAAVRVLNARGRWLVQSDHAEYFQEMIDLLSSHEGLAEVPWEEAEASSGPGWQGTNFEIKYVREGREIHRAAYVARA
ncbi:MAG: tRNA (guanosine(46)-N7)-methyltransferase TrmB [Planctomycetes bacterium]|nr:tRNA (guanosine(46)-N7)-methyltransferase TrmB [Planctomycetota bacterium]